MALHRWQRVSSTPQLLPLQQWPPVYSFDRAALVSLAVKTLAQMPSTACARLQAVVQGCSCLPLTMLLRHLHHQQLPSLTTAWTRGTAFPPTPASSPAATDTCSACKTTEMLSCTGQATSLCGTSCTTLVQCWCEQNSTVCQSGISMCCYDCHVLPTMPVAARSSKLPPPGQGMLLPARVRLPLSL